MNIDGIEYIKKEELDKIQKEFNDFKDNLKTEKTIITEPADVMGIVKVELIGDKLVSKHNPKGKWEFDNIPASCWISMNDDEKIECEYKDFKVTISLKFYKTAKKILSLFSNSKAKIYVRKSNYPVLICDGEGLGFILAPRMESE